MLIRRAAVIAVALGALIALVSPAFAGRWVIPPGQEALVMRMLGGDPSGGCRFAGASIEKTEIKARYACAGGEVRVALRHPSDAPNAAVRAQKLAIVPDAEREGAAPKELLDALGARLRAEEAAWRWMAEGRSLGRTLAEAGLSPRARRLVVPLGAAAALAFAATFALALAIARRFDRGGDAGDLPADARRALGEAAIVATLVFAFLELGFGGAPVHSDTTRDLLMAADCLAGHGCDHGPPTTLGVIVQGALWTRFLAFSRVIGLSIGATQAAVYLLHGVAAGVVYLSTRRRFGRDLAPVVAALFAAGTAFLLDAPILWNPSLSPLPLAAFHATLVALAWDRDEDGARRGIALAAGAAIALALAVDCHVLFAVLAPALFAAVAGCARRPVPAVLAAALVFTITLAVDSRTAWSVNARAFVEAGAALPLGGMLILATASAALARPRLAQISPGARAAVFIGAAAAYTTGATAALFAVLGPAAGHRYLAPAVPGLALAVAAIARRRAAVRAAVAAAAAMGAWYARPRAGDGWTLADAEAAAAVVYERAPRYRDVLAQTRARSKAIIAALAIFEPRRAHGSGGDPGEDQVLLLAPKAMAKPSGPRVTTLARGARTLVIAGVQPYLDRARTTFCFAPRAGISEEMGCADGSIARETSGPETPEERAYPALAAVRDAFPPELLQRFGGVRQTITIAVKPWPGPPHRVALLDPSSGYRIAEVRGVRFHGALPAPHVVLEGGAGAGEIVLAREHDAATPRPDRYWMPALVEVPEDEVDLVRMLDGGG